MSQADNRADDRTHEKGDDPSENPADAINEASRKARLPRREIMSHGAEHNTVRPLARCSRADHSCARLPPAALLARNNRLVTCVPAAAVTLPDKQNQGEPKMVRPANFSSRLLLALGMGIVGALSACQTPPPPAPTAVAHTEQFVATVVSVDMTTREVVLSTPDGRQTTVVAGPNVTNLGRLKPGDRLTVTFNDAIAVQMATPGSPPVGTSASEIAANGHSINTNARVTIVSEWGAQDGREVWQ